MNIEWIIPCRYLEVHDNLATIVGGGIDNFWLPVQPRIVQVMFAIRLTAMHEELTGGTHRIVNEIKGPDGQVMHHVEGELGTQATGDVLNPDWLQGMVIPAGAQFQADQEGTYTVVHRLDGSEHSLPLHVHHSAPPGVQLPPGSP